MRLFIILAYILGVSISSRKNEPYKYIVGDPTKYNKYNFETFNEKLEETVKGFCSNDLDYDIIDSYSNESVDLMLNKTITLQVIPPDRKIVSDWFQIQPAFTHITQSLCSKIDKINLKIGCSKGVPMHPDAPRCHKEKTYEYCQQFLMNTNNQFSPKQMIDILQFKQMQNYDNAKISFPFLIHAKNAISTNCGGAINKCGFIQPKANCASARERFNLFNQSLAINSCITGINHESCNKFKKVKKLFILSYKYDSAFGHFMLEVMPRIVYYINFLKDKDVHIHLGCDKKYDKFKPPKKFLSVKIIINIYFVSFISS